VNKIEPSVLPEKSARVETMTKEGRVMIDALPTVIVMTEGPPATGRTAILPTAMTQVLQRPYLLGGGNLMRQA
jgi:hypothetical protein